MSEQKPRGREIPLFEFAAVVNNPERIILHTFKRKEKPFNSEFISSIVDDDVIDEEEYISDFMEDDQLTNTNEEFNSDQSLVKESEHKDDQFQLNDDQSIDEIQEFIYCPFYDGLILITTTSSFNSTYSPKLKLLNCKTMEITPMQHLNEILCSGVFGERNNSHNTLKVRSIGDGTIVMALNNICVGVNRLGAILWSFGLENPIRNISAIDSEHLIILTSQKLLKLNKQKVSHVYDFMFDSDNLEVLFGGHMKIIDDCLFLRYSTNLKIFNIENLEEILSVNVENYCNGSHFMSKIDSFLLLDGFVMDIKNRILIKQSIGRLFLLDDELYSWIQYSYQYQDKLFVMHDWKIVFYNTSNWSIKKIDRISVLNDNEIDQIDRLGGFSPIISSNPERITDWNLFFTAWNYSCFKMDQYVVKLQLYHSWNNIENECEKCLIAESVSQEQFLKVFLTKSNTIILQTDWKQEESVSMNIIDYLSKLHRVEVFEFTDHSYEYFTVSLDFPLMVKMVDSTIEKEPYFQRFLIGKYKPPKSIERSVIFSLIEKIGDKKFQLDGKYYFKAELIVLYLVMREDSESNCAIQLVERYHK